MTPSDGAGGSIRGLPRLHAVTDDAVLAADGWLDRARRVVEAGAGQVAVHVRGRHTGPRSLLGLAEGLLPSARRSGATVIVNDRVDVALAAHVDGVHLGGGSLPLEHARRVLGPSVRIGVSCHDAREVGLAAREGADYVFLGTIHPTASHPEAHAMGIEGLAMAARRATLPVIGIGGIGASDVAEAVAAGAHGVAAIRGIWLADDPAEAVRRYLEGLGEREGEDVGSDGHHSHPLER